MPFGCNGVCALGNAEGPEAENNTTQWDELVRFMFNNLEKKLISATFTEMLRKCHL